MNSEKAARWFAICWTAAVFVFLSWRAWNIQVTPDEAYTFNAFIQSCNSLTPWVKWEANNHLLNTLFSAASVNLFGPYLFALRLANLLSWLLFAWAAFQLTLPIRSTWARSAGLVVLSSSPLLLEFFGLSRGYGMSMALMLLSLVFLRKILEGNINSSWWWLLVAVLILLANLNLLPFIALSGFVVYVSMKRAKALFLATLLIILAAFAWYGFKLKAEGLLYFGGQGFWTDTVGKSLFLMTGTAWGQRFYVLLLIPLTLGLIRSKPGDPRGPEHFPFLILLLLVLQVSGVIFQHMLLQTPYPEGRTAMHLWLLLTLAAVLFAPTVPRAAWWYSVIAIGLLCSTVVSLDQNRSYHWKDAFISDALLDALDSKKQLNPHLSVGIAYPFGYTWSFLQRGKSAPIVAQRLGADNALDGYDVLGLAPDATTPEGFECMPGGDLQSYRFYQRVKDKNDKTFTPQSTSDHQSTDEFVTLFESRFVEGDKGIQLLIDLRLTVKGCGELFLVFKADDGRYEQIDLTDYAEAGQLETAIVRNLFGTPQRGTRWSAYLWNPMRLENSLRAEVGVHRRMNPQNIQ